VPKLDHQRNTTLYVAAVPGDNPELCQDPFPAQTHTLVTVTKPSTLSSPGDARTPARVRVPCLPGALVNQSYQLCQKLGDFGHWAPAGVVTCTADAPEAAVVGGDKAAVTANGGGSAGVSYQHEKERDGVTRSERDAGHNDEDPHDEFRTRVNREIFFTSKDDNPLKKRRRQSK
jgi:hypothetical protein